MTKRLTFPVLADGDALALLDKSCTDFTILNRDWPRHRFRWEVRAMYFFARGRGVGQTFGEAAQRAIYFMDKHDATLPRADPKDVPLI